MSIFIHHYESPIGELLIGDFNNTLCLCDWRYRNMRKSIDQRIQKGLNAEYVEQTTELHQEVVKQLDDYFAEELKTFDLQLTFVGSDFQKSVWQALVDIPFGDTLSYHALSEQLGNTLAIRAVASANGANAISIIVPCHRIIGKDGKLTGYAGGLKAKQKLLELEGSYGQMEFGF